MSWRAEVGFDVDVIGELKLDVTEDNGSSKKTYTITISTGRFCHTDISGVGTLSASDYTDFATKLKNTLDSESSSSGHGFTYTVSWDGSNQEYTLSVGTGNTFAFGETGGSRTDPYDRTLGILGFSGDTSQQNSHTSDMTPTYVLFAKEGGASNYEDDFEPEGLVSVAESRGGSHFAQRQSTGITYGKWEIQGEPREKTIKRAADDGTSSGDIPWTYQHMVEHASAIEPFLVVDDRESTVHFLRESTAFFGESVRTRMRDNWDDAWNWVFDVYTEGRL